MGKGGFASTKGSSQTESEHVEVHLFGKRVDVSHFLRKHPGGAKALKIFKDRDATEQFLMYHSPAATKKMQMMAQNAPDAPPESSVFTSTIGTDFE